MSNYNAVTNVVERLRNVLETPDVSTIDAFKVRNRIINPLYIFAKEHHKITGKEIQINGV